MPCSQGFRVEWPEGPRTYPSKRQTIIALVNQTPTPTRASRDPRWSFDRYFRRGRYSRSQAIPSVDVFVLFTPDPPKQVTVSTRSPWISPDPGLVVHVTDVGIDVDKRALDIRRIFISAFRSRLKADGYDLEDVLQEVYAGIIVRNRGTCPFDPSKGTFSGYVRMVGGCIYSNYKRKHRRRRQNEISGVRTFGGEIVDVAEADLESVEPFQDDYSSFVSTTELLSHRVAQVAPGEGVDPDLARKCIQFLLEGRYYREMAEIMDTTVSLVSQAVRLVRRVASEWRAETALI